DTRPLGVEFAERDRVALHESRISYSYPMTVHYRGGAMPRDVLEVPGSQNLDSGRLGSLYHRLSQRMLRLALDGGCQTEQFGLRHAVDRHLNDLGLALGQGAGLVHDHHLNVGRSLERGGIFEQDAPL